MADGLQTLLTALTDLLLLTQWSIPVDEINKAVS